MSDFNTTAEIYQWLLDGNKIKSNVTNVVYFIKNGNLFPETVNAVFQWHKYIEPKWYENIPKQGVLCWCGNSKDNLKAIGIITEKGYNNGFYSKSNAHYCYATPLTNEEIKQFLLPD